jgi:hypothetical protein
MHAFAYVNFFSYVILYFYSYLLTTLSSSLGRISSPCVLCVCVTELPRFRWRRWLFLWGSHQPFSSFVCLVCLPFCLLIEVIYSNRMYLSACADGDVSVAHGGHSSLITFLFFFLVFIFPVCEPTGSIGRVWFLFHFVFLFLILFLFIQFISFFY